MCTTVSVFRGQRKATADDISFGRGLQRHFRSSCIRYQSSTKSAAGPDDKPEMLEMLDRHRRCRRAKTLM